MADYTEEQLKAAARNAHAAGDMEAAQRFIAEARRVGGVATSTAPAAQDPMLPSPDNDTRSTDQFLQDTAITQPVEQAPQESTWGNTALDVAKSSGSGILRGARNVVSLPAMAGGALDAGYEKLGLIPEGGAAAMQEADPLSMQNINSVTSALTGGATEYQPETTAGEFAQTGADFATGAGIMGGPAAAMRFGLAPGLVSEGAGQLTEDVSIGGVDVEPYARAGSAVVASLLGSPKPGAFKGGDEASRMANSLQDSGVRNITTGQSRGSQPMMRAEGRLQATPQQIDDFTASTMRQLGSADSLATPANLRAVEDTVVQQMDDALRGVSIAPNQTQAAQAAQVGADYVARVPAGSLTPRVRGIADEIGRAAQSGTPLPLSALKTWRSDIGKLTVSPDAATREAAHSLRSMIDDMTDTALTAAGRTDDIASLAAARETYRNYIGVRDAASRAGAEGGTLSPQALNQSVIRSQGREAYATGRTTPMAEFTRAGASVLRPAPTTNAGGVRSISEALPVAAATVAGGGALQAGVDPVIAGLLAAGGAMTPSAMQSAMRSNLVQTALRDPLKAATQTAPMLPGVLSIPDLLSRSGEQ